MPRTPTKSKPKTAEPAPYLPVVIQTDLFPSCRNAAAIEAGTLRSLTRPDPDDWRRACRQAFHALNGDLHLCASEFHTEHPRCRLCHLDHDDLETLTEDLRCEDWQGCEERRENARVNHPRHVVWEGIVQRAQEARAETNRLRALEKLNNPSSPREPKARTLRSRVAKEPTPLDARCEHCGEPTKGGRFVAGHDAKLKGLLLQEAKAGSVEAIAEMLLRNWVKESTRKTIAQEARKRHGASRVGDAGHVAAEAEVGAMFEQAEAIIQSRTTLDFLSERVASRLQAGVPA